MNFKTVIVAVLAAGLSSASVSKALVQEDAPTKPTCTDNSAQCQNDQAFYRLSAMIYGCKDTEKQQGVFSYSICLSNGKVLSAKEWNTEAPDVGGITYFFSNAKVVAVFYHSGDLAIIENGKLIKMYEDGGIKVKTKFTKAERQNIEKTAANGYRSILKKFGR